MVYNIIKKRNRTGRPEKEEQKMTAIREEELNMVNGGTVDEIVMDSQALYDKGYLSESYNRAEVILAYFYCAAKVTKCWGMSGVTCDTGFFGDNKYELDGREISRGEALRHIHAF